MKGLVSIIVPVYNGETFIEKCIKSLISQTYQNIEILVVNDGSTDNTLNELQKMTDARLKIIDIPNGGVSNARNVGLINATGEYIMFVDADDYLRLDAIEILYNKAIKTGVDIIRFNGYVENTNGCIKKIEFPFESGTIIKSKYESDKVIFLMNDSKKSLRGYCWLLFMKNDNIVPFNIELSYLEDKIFYIENLTQDKEILLFDESLYYYIFNQNSKTKNFMKFYDNILDILDAKDVEILIMKKKKYDYQKLLDASYGRLLLYRLDFYINGCNYKTFKTCLLQMLDNDRIRDALIFSDEGMKWFKKIQYLLLKKRLFYLLYILTKLKYVIK